MIPSNIAISGLSDDEKAIFDRLLGRLNERTPRNLLRASYYDGRRAVSEVGSVIPPQYYNLGIVLGWAAKSVDLLARRCNLDGFVWPDGDLESLGATDLWDRNMLGSEVDQALVSSLIHGPSFVVTTRGDVPGESLVHFKSGLDATGEWNSRSRSLESLLSVTGRDSDGSVSEVTLYLDGLTVICQLGSSGRWSVVDRQVHPWGVPADMLVYKPRLGRPFGSSRISRPIMSLQDRATAEIIRTEGHMDVYSYPEFWMLCADGSVFKNSDGTPKASWQVMLGRIKGLPDDNNARPGLERAEVKHFPAASPQPHLAWLNALAKLMAREASLPDTALAISDVSNPTSAESYDASQYELIAEAEGATDDWTPALRRAQARALAIQNGLDAVPASWASIDANWRNPRYLSRSAQADAGMKQLTAVPWLAETKVGLELLGLDEQQVKLAMAERVRARASANIQALAGRTVVESDAVEG